MIKKIKYDIIFITNLSSFYKINLYNKIAKSKKILVIFTHVQDKQRNNDFYNGEKEFNYIYLSQRTLLNKIFSFLRLLMSIQYKFIIVGGWDQLILWIAVIISSRNKNGVLVESSIFESKVKGVIRWIKKIFLSRVSKAYVSGKSQSDLCLTLGFHGKIIKTKGVGIFNIRAQQKYLPKSIVKNFIFVGRLSPEKNIQLLIETFNKLPGLTLNIVGFGPLEFELKSIANQNINFLGAIPNAELFEIYQQNDVFVLPSYSEPWGMVVEEALNCGLPVIVSDRVGCAEEIINESNGIVFKLSDPFGFKKAIDKILDIDNYNSLRSNISKMDFKKIAQEQINSYL